MPGNHKTSLPLTMVPSLPAASFFELENLANALVGVAEGFQIDIVDGKFAPHISWPFTEPDLSAEWEKITALTQKFKIELDCMVEKPEQYLDIFASLSLTKLIVHMDSTEKYSEIIQHAKDHGCQIGLAFTNDIPLNFLYPYIDKVDFVQIMGIAQVGSQGQPFDERTLISAKTLRAKFPELSIAVDGSVNAATIPKLLAAGVNHFAPGSAISQSLDPAAAYKQLQSLLA